MSRFVEMVFLIAISAPAIAAGQVCVKRITVPDYPPVARAAQMRGAIDLSITIGAHGRVTNVVGAGLSPLLVDHAKENIEDWLFCDPKKDGNRQVHLRFDYRLEGTPVYPLPNAKVLIDLGEGTIVITSPPMKPQP